MNSRILYPVMLLVGVGIGTGIGMLISKPKIEEQKKQVDLLAKQMQTEKAESEEVIAKAASEIARNKKLLTQTMADLATANQRLKAMTSTLPESTEPVVVITTQNNEVETAVSTVDYTVKEGDSFWKIAEEQLDNGDRYKEILRVNPNLTENQTLVIGTKIKIPAQ